MPASAQRPVVTGGSKTESSRGRPLIDLTGVSIGYGDAAVLHEVTLQVRVGERLALIGPSGAGKTTLVFALCGCSLGVVLANFFFEHTIIRLLCAFVQAIHELFWAFLLLPIVGLDPICGILAIAIPYAEIRQEAYPRRRSAPEAILTPTPIRSCRVFSVSFWPLPCTAGRSSYGSRRSLAPSASPPSASPPSAFTLILPLPTTTWM